MPSFNFSKIKNKLEATLDDMEDALEKEKRARVEQDKARSPFYQPLHLAMVAKKLDHFLVKIIA